MNLNKSLIKSVELHGNLNFKLLWLFGIFNDVFYNGKLKLKNVVIMYPLVTEPSFYQIDDEKIWINAVSRNPLSEIMRVFAHEISHLIQFHIKNKSRHDDSFYKLVNETYEKLLCIDYQFLMPLKIFSCLEVEK